MQLWIVICVSGVLAFLERFSFIGLQGDRQLPEPMRRALRLVPASVLAAIVWPAVLAPNHALQLTPENVRVYAALIAAAVAWRTKNMLATMGVGMLALWLLQAIIASY